MDTKKDWTCGEKALLLLALVFVTVGLSFAMFMMFQGIFSLVKHQKDEQIHLWNDLDQEKKEMCRDMYVKSPW